MSYVTPVTIDEPVRSRLKELGSTRKRTINWMIREAISEYVDREERKEQFKQEAITTWRNYQLTGLHVTEEEMDDWMDKIKNGKDAELPVCHV